MSAVAETNGPARERRRRRTLIAGACVTAAAAIAAAVVVLSGDSTPGPGPLGVTPDPNGLANHRPLGAPFTYSLPVIWNTSDRPVRVDGVRLIDRSPDLRLVAALVAGPDRPHHVYSGDYRDARKSARYGDLHPLRGYVLPPKGQGGGRRDHELVLVLQADRPGRWGFRGIEIDYSVDGTHYRDIDPSAYDACVSRSFDPHKTRDPSDPRQRCGYGHRPVKGTG